MGSLINDNVPVDIVITELKERLLDTLSPETLPSSQRVKKVLELSCKHLNITIQDCACFLATFPGSFSEDAAISVLNIPKVFDSSYPTLNEARINNPRQCLKRLEEASLLEHYWHADQSRYQLHILIKELFDSQPLCEEKDNVTEIGIPRGYSLAFYYAELLLEVVERHASVPGNDEDRDILERDRHNFETFRSSVDRRPCSIMKEELNFGDFWLPLLANKLLVVIATPGDLLSILFTKTELRNIFLSAVCISSMNRHIGAEIYSWKLLGMTMFNNLTECYKLCDWIWQVTETNDYHKKNFTQTICYLDCFSIHKGWLMNSLIGICYTLVIVMMSFFCSPCDLRFKSVARKVAILWTLLVSNPWLWSSLDLTEYTYKSVSLSLHILFVSAINNLCIISIALLLLPSRGFEYRVFQVLSSNLVFIHFSLCVLLTTSFVNIFYNTITSFCALVAVAVLIRGDIGTAYYILNFFIVVVVCFACVVVMMYEIFV